MEENHLEFNLVTFQMNRKVSENLQVLNVTSISNEECKRKASIFHDSHLCTLGPRGEGICKVSN